MYQVNFNKEVKTILFRIYLTGSSDYIVNSTSVLNIIDTLWFKQEFRI